MQCHSSDLPQTLVSIIILLLFSSISFADSYIEPILKMQETSDLGEVNRKYWEYVFPKVLADAILNLSERYGIDPCEALPQRLMTINHGSRP